MGYDVWYALDKHVLERSEASALSTSSFRNAHPLMQTFPVWSVMHGRYEGITKGDFVLTEPSQMIGDLRQGRVANFPLDVYWRVENANMIRREHVS
jgi:hypothetical protein